MSSPGEIDSAVPPTTPASPASPAPIAKVIANTSCTLTPEAASIVAVVDAGADHHADARAAPGSHHRPTPMTIAASSTTRR